MSQASERPASSREAGEAYDAVVTRLERVVGELESGQLTLEQSIEKFAEGRGRLGRVEPRARIRALMRRAEDATRRLGRWQASTFPRERLRLERLRARLEPANVAKLLARGFALALRGKRLVTRSDEVDAGEALRLALAAGWLDVTVTSRDEGDDPLPGRGRGPA